MKNKISTAFQAKYVSPSLSPRHFCGQLAKNPIPSVTADQPKDPTEISRRLRGVDANTPPSSPLTIHHSSMTAQLSPVATLLYLFNIIDARCSHKTNATVLLPPPVFSFVLFSVSVRPRNVSRLICAFAAAASPAPSPLAGKRDGAADR